MKEKFVVDKSFKRARKWRSRTKSLQKDCSYFKKYAHRKARKLWKEFIRSERLKKFPEHLSSGADLI